MRARVSTRVCVCACVRTVVYTLYVRACACERECVRVRECACVFGCVCIYVHADVYHACTTNLSCEPSVDRLSMLVGCCVSAHLILHIPLLQCHIATLHSAYILVVFAPALLLLAGIRSPLLVTGQFMNAQACTCMPGSATFTRCVPLRWHDFSNPVDGLARWERSVILLCALIAFISRPHNAHQCSDIEDKDRRTRIMAQKTAYAEQRERRVVAGNDIRCA